ncbi:PD-(D/E)XK nuclease domain-containing protein [Terrilactibacillus laevilacticus]|uniref:Protein NO VEIN C-terminal domain-containing protein n=1 Tax=Terrilactibacillus laevilacticus TaxID=1380157 RepID=A0ABW5PKB7_9BACI|nr:hypothetical protein [Terrilactibacillus laevilacticus]
MSITNLNKSPKLAIQEINKKIDDLEKVMKLYELNKGNLSLFEDWKSDVKNTLDQMFSEKSISKDFLNETIVFVNKFSETDTTNKVNNAYKKAIVFLENLKSNIESGIYLSEIDDSIDRSVAIIIIRRILLNFYMHIKAMYQNDVHGNGKIKKDDLDKIRIGNEYDVQRILYSLIKPIFPYARLEVFDDAGYNSVRYDIILDEYGIVIEVKCTRPSMTEHKITEELGADSFHYKADHLFLFIFDKEKVIKDPKVFEKAFNRKKNDFGKELETIVIQEVTF